MVAALLLVEIALRVLDIAYPSVMQSDNYRGFSYTPGSEWTQDREGLSHVVINSEGFNERERELEKKPGYFRIAVLGDSYTAALQVERKRRFTEILEDELNQRKCFSPKNVEVLNFGVSDYGTAQELMVLRHNVWRYTPDMVILAFWPANDLNDNSMELSRHLCRPFGIIQDGELDLDYSFRSLLSHRCGRIRIGHVINHSRLLQLVKQAYKKTRNMRQNPLEANEQRGNETLSTLLELADSPRAFSIYHESNDEERRQSWQVTDALISLMSKEVRENEAEFFVASLGTQLQVTPDKSVREKLRENTGGDTLFYPGNRIKAIGRREGFSVLDLAPSFQQFADKHQIYLHRYIKDNGRVKPFGHWTERGHQLAAQLISGELCRAR